MTTRRIFIKTTGLATLATALGCGDESGASAGGDALSADLGGGDASSADTASEDAAVEDTAPLPELEDYVYDGPLGPEDLFQHGVASGDPLATSVVLWTRVTQPGAEPVPVFWDVATDPEFTARVAAGWGEAAGGRDFTLKLIATGLAPATTYYYRFRALGRTAPLGRTRTLPDGPTERVRLALGSCAEIQTGWYHAYGHMGGRSDLDAVVFVGDYLYEYGLRAGRLRDTAPPHELTTLEHYRTRYAHYRREPQLQEAHRQHPWIVVWDDHEVANNSWRAGDSNGDTGEVFRARRDAGVAAWHEWMPCRTGELARGEGGASDAGVAIYRRFDFGDLVRLAVLETRLYGRDEPVNANNPVGVELAERTLLGPQQEAWLDAEISGATQRWVVLGQQIMMAPLTDGVSPINYDQWDGYPAARQRVLDAASARADLGLVVLAGDIHSSWGNDLPGTGYDGENGAVGVEFVTPGIASTFPTGLEAVVDVAKLANPHIKYGDVSHRGYVVVDLSRDSVRGTWFHVADANLEQSEVEPAATFVSDRLAPHLLPAATPDDVEAGPALAP